MRESRKEFVKVRRKFDNIAKGDWKHLVVPLSLSKASLLIVMSTSSYRDITTGGVLSNYYTNGNNGPQIPHQKSVGSR